VEGKVSNWRWGSRRKPSTSDRGLKKETRTEAVLDEGTRNERVEQSERRTDANETSLPKANIDNCFNLRASGNSENETESKLEPNLAVKRNDMSHRMEGYFEGSKLEKRLQSLFYV